MLFRTGEQLAHLSVELCFQFCPETVVWFLLLCLSCFLGLHLGLCSVVSDQPEVVLKQLNPVWLPASADGALCGLGNIF